MILFLKNWALVIAISLGFLLHDTVGRCMFMAPYLLFVMLLLTFCMISPRDLRFERLHLVLLWVQLAGVLVLYGIFVPLGPVSAGAAAITVFMPPATAASVITGMLGGSIAFTAAYTCLSSLAVALVAPLLLPLISTSHGDVALLPAMLAMAERIIPVLVFPLVLVWLLQYKAPAVHQRLLRLNGAAFWLWALLLVILMGSTFNFILASDAAVEQVIGMAAIGVLSCVIQFAAGKYVGARYGRRVSGGQSLAQKNAALGMWLCFHYLDPVTAISCAAYSVTQNTVNSFQLWRFRRTQAAGSLPVS